MTLLNLNLWETVLSASWIQCGKRFWRDHCGILGEGPWSMPGSSLLSAAGVWTSLLPELMDHWGGMGCILLYRVLCQDASAKPVVPTGCRSDHSVLWPGLYSAILLALPVSPCVLPQASLPTTPATHSRHHVGTSGPVMAPTYLEADRTLAQTLAVSFILFWMP